MRYLLSIALFFLLLGAIAVGAHLTTGLMLKTARYDGPQTVQALMETFDAHYTARTAKTEWATTVDIPNRQKREFSFTLTEVDSRYPRAVWLQTFLNSGIRITGFQDYAACLNRRADLIFKEFHDTVGTGDGRFETEVQDYQRIAEAKRAAPPVEGWIVIGTNVLPKIPGRIYVQTTDTLANIWYTAQQHRQNAPMLTEAEKLDLLTNGTVPAGWEVVYLDENGARIRHPK